MIHLQTFGRVEVSGRGGPSLGVLSQPKRLALFVYLAVARPRGLQSRDRILALFWPESDTLHARNALSQALTFLRRELGADTLVTRGADGIGIDERALVTDVVALEGAIDAGRWTEALETYQGDFLDGLHVDDAPEVMAWLDQERNRLRELAARAGVHVANEARSRGDFSAALTAIRRVRHWAPLDEPALRLQMVIEADSGNRAGAAVTFDAFRAALQREIGVEPSTETQRLADAIIRGSWTSSGGLPHPEPGAGVRGAAAARVAQVPRRPAFTAMGARGRFAVVAGTVLLAFSAGAWFAFGPHGEGQKSDVDIVVMAPLGTTGVDSSLSYLGRGIVELLAAQFTGEGTPRALDPAVVFRSWDRHAGSSGFASERQLFDWAHGLAGTRLLRGSIVGGPSRITVQAFLTRVDDGTVQGEPITVHAHPDSLGVLINELSVRLIGESAGLWKLSANDPTTTSVEALREFLAGRAARTFPEMIPRLTRALELDSTFALASLWLTIQEMWGLQLPDRERTVRLAWQNRGRLSREYRLLLEAWLGPNGPGKEYTLRDQYAAVEQASRLMPHSVNAWFLYGDRMMHRGAIVGIPDWRERARAGFTRVLAIDPTDDVARGALGHLATLAYAGSDTVEHRRLTAELTRLAPPGSHLALWERYAASVRDGPPEKLRVARDSFARADLARVLDGASYPGYAWSSSPLLPQSETDSLIATLERLARTPAHAAAVRTVWAGMSTNGGRVRRVRELRRINLHGDTLGAALAALYAGEDDMASVRMLDRALRAGLEHHQKDEFRCEVMLARLRKADTSGLGYHSSALLASGTGHARHCVETIEGIAASLRRPAALGTLRRLDSVNTAGRMGPKNNALAKPTWSHDIALAFSRHGLWAEAAAAARRRAFAFDRPHVRLGIRLRDEGRWAALAGDTTAAIDAFRQYLLLRETPDPELVPERDSIRREYQQLLASRRPIVSPASSVR